MLMTMIHLNIDSLITMYSYITTDPYLEIVKLRQKYCHLFVQIWVNFLVTIFSDQNGVPTAFACLGNVCFVLMKCALCMYICISQAFACLGDLLWVCVLYIDKVYVTYVYLDQNGVPTAFACLGNVRCVCCVFCVCGVLTKFEVTYVHLDHHGVPTALACS
jgi:hypothetical protein